MSKMVCINRIPHILFFCCGGVFIFLLFSNTTSNGEMLQSHEVSYGDAIALYETKNNLLEGDYMSCYKNQTVKCRGQFHNNMRVGLWTVYDSLGNEKMQRKYRNNFEFEQIYPPLPKSGPIKILKEPYPLKYNKDGFIDYFFLNERAVVVSKRIWRTIDLDPYHLTFFSSQKLMGSIVDSVIAKKYVEYADDDFRDTISKSGLAMLLDTANYYLEGFDCKEDWFFDNDRMLSETRIIGISPLVIPRGDVGDKHYHLGWFYFPQLRKTFAKIETGKKSCPKYIHTLDDLFFFRYFHGDIYKESNIYDRRLSDYTKPESMDDERDRIEVSMLEMEHDLWINFYK